jgi:tRNA U34 5-methylaminomethyl-2-thiouridine-forming methyltransferase MnmC
MLYREIIVTSDGSTTILIPEWNESYHSRHGSIQEAYHVFIGNGLNLISKKEISILEIGFGTGLNAFITLIEALKNDLKINYTGIEKYPVTATEAKKLNYAEELSKSNPSFSGFELENYYSDLIQAQWEKEIQVAENFNLTKIRADFFDFNYPENHFDLVYFDAFGFRVQPELWTEKLFEKLYKSLKPDGIFTTYSAKGSVRRSLISLGFKAEKKPGPPGKREMLVAKK